MNQLTIISFVVISSLLEVVLTHSCSNEILSRAHTTIEFTPNIGKLHNPGNNNFTEADITRLINVVSNRFTNLLIPTVKNGSPFSFREVIIFIAKWNALQNRKLQVTLWISGKPSGKDQLLRFISECNSIYPTIKSVLVNLDESTNLSHSAAYLQELQAQLLKLNVKLGLKLYMHQCDVNGNKKLKSYEMLRKSPYTATITPQILPSFFTLPVEIEKLVSIVDFIVLCPKWIYDFKLPEENVNYLLKEFYLCEKAMDRKVKENVTVNLMFGVIVWRDKWVERGQQAGEYWKRIGSWAQKSKNQIYLLSAFDNPFLKLMNEMDAIVGWWKIGNLTGSENKAFEAESLVERICEKAEKDDMSGDAKSRELNEKNDTFSCKRRIMFWMITIVIVLIICLGILILVLFVWCIMKSCEDEN